MFGMLIKFKYCFKSQFNLQYIQYRYSACFETTRSIDEPMTRFASDLNLFAMVANDGRQAPTTQYYQSHPTIRPSRYNPAVCIKFHSREPRTRFVFIDSPSIYNNANIYYHYYCCYYCRQLQPRTKKRSYTGLSISPKLIIANCFNTLINNKLTGIIRFSSY